MTATAPGNTDALVIHQNVASGKDNIFAIDIEKFSGFNDEGVMRTKSTTISKHTSMMKSQTIFLLLYCFIKLSSCRTETTNQSNKTKTDEKVVEVTDLTTGNVKTVTKDANELPNGLTTHYDSNRVVRLKEMYVNGKKEGSAYAYNERGDLIYEGFNKDGERDSICKWFYETGELQRLEYYRKGVQCWDGFYYYNDGEIGVHVFSDNSGNLRYKGNYDNSGKLVKFSGTPIFVTWTEKIAVSENFELGIFATANPEFRNNCSISLVDSDGNVNFLAKDQAINEDFFEGFTKRLVVRRQINQKGNYTIRIKTDFFTSLSKKAKMSYSKELNFIVE